MIWNDLEGFSFGFLFAQHPFFNHAAQIGATNKPQKNNQKIQSYPNNNM